MRPENRIKINQINTMEKSLKEQYDELANAYAQKFCEIYGFEDYDTHMSIWVADDPGEIACIGDYYIGYNEIRYCVDNQIGWETFDSWYHYRLDCGMIDHDISTPNLDSWVKGCPRMSEEDLEELRKSKLRMHQAEEEFEKSLKRLMNKPHFK